MRTIRLLAGKTALSLFFLLSLFVSAIPHAFSQNQPVRTDLNTDALVTVPFSETRSFYSEILGQEMVLFIKIPAGYDKDTLKIFPCWYGTDANLAFPLAANIARLFEVPVVVEPEIFVVGIGYKIREAIAKKVPIIPVVGKKEAAEGTVSLRRRGENKS